MFVNIHQHGFQRRGNETTKGEKTKLTASEIALLTDKVAENIHIIQSKLINSVRNKNKNQIWKEITDAVNAVGVANRTVQEIKDKWKNMHSAAKKEFSSFRKEKVKTGGRPAPMPPSLATEQIIEMFKKLQASSACKDLRQVRELTLCKQSLITRPRPKRPGAES